jgi:protein-tyrosine-phosphatase
MARHLFKMNDWPDNVCKNGILELANLSITMFHDAIESFILESADLAKKTILIEETVDALRESCIKSLLEVTKNQEVPLALLNIIRRFERVADQARNICMEVLYLTTGEYAKHPGAEAFRVLFVDEHNSLRSRIAEAVANKLNQPRFIFSSAGIDPKPIDPRTIQFMKSKGYDISNTTPRSVSQIPNLDSYNVIVAFSSEAKQIFPREPRKTIYLDWEVEAPSFARDDAETVEKKHENVFQFVTKHVNNLVNAVIGSKAQQEER